MTMYDENGREIQAADEPQNITHSLNQVEEETEAPAPKSPEAEQAGTDASAEENEAAHEEPAAAAEATTARDKANVGPAYSPFEEKPVSRVRTIVLCSVLAVALLFGAFFGGAAIGRFAQLGNAPGYVGGAGNGSGGNGGNQNSGINRGDLTIQVVERDETVWGDGDIPTIVKNVQSTVVEIRTETTVTSAIYGNYVESGAGSGVIMSAKGLILTCDHVINGAGSITVVLNNGQEYQAEVYGQDSWSDLALLKIEAEGLTGALCPQKATEAGVAYEDYLAVGEGVLAIGNPLGELGGSVSNGIISALGRRVTIEGTPMTLLQTNAAVNPGNSGGALFNMYGELIGIVNAKSTGESVEGIGFAIPISDALPVMKQLYSQGYVSGRPHLGLYFESTTNGLKILSYDYNDELTGGQTIQNGDLLYSVDGKQISTFADLRAILATKQIGDTIQIEVERYVRQGYTYYRAQLTFTIVVHEYIPAFGEGQQS